MDFWLCELENPPKQAVSQEETEGLLVPVSFKFFWSGAISFSLLTLEAQ
jgi:hypothetical protein